MLNMPPADMLNGVHELSAQHLKPESFSLRTFALFFQGVLLSWRSNKLLQTIFKGSQRIQHISEGIRDPIDDLLINALRKQERNRFVQKHELTDISLEFVVNV
jgi:hypothetical protein